MVIIGGSTGGENKQRKAKNRVDDKYYRTEGMRYEDLVKLAQDLEPWRIMTANLLKEDEDDDDIHLHVNKSYAQTGMRINSRNNSLLINNSLTNCRNVHLFKKYYTNRLLKNYVPVCT